MHKAGSFVDTEGHILSIRRRVQKGLPCRVDADKKDSCVELDANASIVLI